MTGSIKELTYYAAETGYVPLGRRLVRARPEVADALNLDEEAEVVLFMGNRTNEDNRPIAYEEVYIPAEFAGDLDNSDLAGKPIFEELS